jgi:hypothetical protein
MVNFNGTIKEINSNSYSVKITKIISPKSNSLVVGEIILVQTLRQVKMATNLKVVNKIKIGDSVMVIGNLNSIGSIEMAHLIPIVTLKIKN